jgi:hypothetical protein
VTTSKAVVDTLYQRLTGEAPVLSGKDLGRTVSKAVNLVAANSNSTVGVDMLQDGISASATVATDNLKFLYAASEVVNGSRWYALVNDQPVAFATAQSAGKNGDMFHDPSGRFATAVASVCQASGIQAGLKMMGFTGLKITMPVGTLLETKTQQAHASGVAEGTEQLEAFRTGVWAALGTAAVGINKQFWTGLVNPIKVALHSSLSAMGVQNAETLIDDAFAKHGDAYHQLVVSKAENLLLLSPSSVNEITTAVASASYQRATTAATLGSQLADRLAAGNVPVASFSSVINQQAPRQNTADFSQDRMHQVIKGLSFR